MKAVFIVTSFWAYGELIIALEFAKSLIKSGGEVHFIIPPTHKNAVKQCGISYSTLIPNSKKINRIIFSEVERTVKADLVILSDFLNYDYAFRHYGIDKSDLEIFSGKLATFDNFDWKLERKCMDTYGYKSDILKKTKIENYGYSICPCPLVDSRKENKLGEYTYALINDTLPNTEKNKIAQRMKFGLPIDLSKKIILISYAKWQGSHINHKGVDSFVKISDYYFDILIMELSKNYTILCIGAEKDKFKNHPNIIAMPSVNPKLFDEYATTVDLYIGRNMTSTTMARLALSNILCINLINSVSSIEKINSGELELMLPKEKVENLHMYPYMMYPVGWYYFLKPLFKSNLYADLIIKKEQFEIEDTIEAINGILFSKEELDSYKHKVEELKHSLSTLMQPMDIALDIMKK